MKSNKVKIEGFIMSFMLNERRGLEFFFFFFEIYACESERDEEGGEGEEGWGSISCREL